MNRTINRKRNPLKPILVVILLAIAGGLSALFAVPTQTQMVNLSPGTLNKAVGTNFSVAAMYNVDNSDTTLTGVGVRFHYDSSKLTWAGFSNVFGTPMGDPSLVTPANDTSNLDNDATTDKFVVLAWTDVGGNWPGASTTLPLKLLDLNFTARADATAGTANINVTFSSGAAGYQKTATNTVVTVFIPPGSITGTVGYGGGESGTIYVGAWDNSNYTNDPKGVAFADGAGVYSIIDLVPGTYYLKSFKSISGATTPAQAALTDPKKQVAAPVTVVSGLPTTVNITLDSRPAVTGLTNDAAPIQSKTWNWNSNQPTGAQFRYAVDQNTTWTAAGDFGATKTATQATGDATYYLHVQAINADGTAGPVTTVSAVLDNTKPTVSNVTLSPSSPVKAGTVQFTITFNEAMKTTVAPTVVFGTDPKTVTGAYTNATTWVGTYSIIAGYDGTQTITISGAQDLAANAMLSDATRTFVVDTTPPVTTLNPLPGTYGNTQNIALTTGGGTDTVYYRVDQQTADPGTGTKPTGVYGGAIPLNAGGAGSITHYWIVFYAKDAVGNEEAVRSVHYTIDTNAPVTMPSFSKTLNSYGGKYYTNDQAGVVVTLSSTPDYKIYYTTDGSTPDTNSPFATTTKSFAAITAAGEYTFKYFAVDPARPGLPETVKTTTVVLNFTPPNPPAVTPAVTSPTSLQPQAISGTKVGDTAIWASTKTDGPVYALDAGTAWNYSQALIEGNNAFTVRAKDAAGNLSATVPLEILYDITKPVTSGWDPAKSAIDQPLNKLIHVHVTDLDRPGIPASGVKLNNTLKMNISGTEYVYGSPALLVNETDPKNVTVTFDITKTATKLFTPKSTYTVRVDAFDVAGNAMATDSYTFVTGDTVGITNKNIGVARDATYTFTAGGGSVPYVWSKTDPNGGSSNLVNQTETTVGFVATVVGAYKVKVTDDTGAFSEADADVIAPIVIGGKPFVPGKAVKDAMTSGGTNTFSATGGKTDGQVNWEASAGSISAAGVYTAPTVTVATDVTVTAYDKFWNKSTVSPVKTTYAFKVYPTVAVTNKPATPPW